MNMIKVNITIFDIGITHCICNVDLSTALVQEMTEASFKASERLLLPVVDLFVWQTDSRNRLHREHMHSHITNNVL